MVKKLPGSSDGLHSHSTEEDISMKASLLRAATALSALVALATVTGAGTKFH
jgi:hypothetical protein